MIVRRVLPLLLAAAAGGAAAAPVRVEPAFGYRIGDRIVAVAQVAADDRAQLDAESLPKAGRVNGWLTLDTVGVTRRSAGLEVIRTFQVTASAPEPRMLFLPRAELKFSSAGRQFTEPLESVPITVSPLAPVEPILRSGLGELRPDRDVPDPDVQGARSRVSRLAAALAVMMLAWLAVRSVAMRSRGFAPFRMASRKLRRLASAQPGDDPELPRRAFRIVHEAFNEVAGHVVFAAQTERFLLSHRQFGVEADAVRAFFERSEKAFFDVTQAAQRGGEHGGGERGRADIAWLADLARRLARLEQPGR